MQHSAASVAVRHTVVVAALIWRNGRVLVQQRSPHGSRPLLWEFPGGKLEANETDAEALVRECVEEMGVAVTVGALAWHTQHTYPDLCVELRLYHATLSSGAAPKALQAERLEWVAPADLADLPFCAADVPLLADLAAGRLPPPEAPC